MGLLLGLVHYDFSRTEYGEHVLIALGWAVILTPSHSKKKVILIPGRTLERSWHMKGFILSPFVVETQIPSQNRTKTAPKMVKLGGTNCYTFAQILLLFSNFNPC